MTMVQLAFVVMIILFRDSNKWMKNIEKNRSKKSTFLCSQSVFHQKKDNYTNDFNNIFFIATLFNPRFIFKIAQRIGPIRFMSRLWFFCVFSLAFVSVVIFCCIFFSVCVFQHFKKSCFFEKNFVSEMVFGVFISIESVHAQHTLCRVGLIFCFYDFIGFCSFAWCFSSNRFYFLSR